MKPGVRLKIDYFKAIFNQSNVTAEKEELNDRLIVVYDYYFQRLYYGKRNF